ncbi:hypothetical protein [Brevundimonas sp. LjRoot202]|uniref:hypothetical protein n=1 Tax=Brevundimonas sp. LjRoot202 TaxID=3342281 RepID=UPI003ECD909B
MADTLRSASDLTQGASLAAEAREARKLELGLVGKMFGGGEEKAGNFGAVAFALSLIGLVAVLFLMPGSDEAKPQAVTILGSVVSGALGFVIGKKT